jgi:hypothetical protein
MAREINFSQIKESINLMVQNQKTIKQLYRFQSMPQRQELALRKEKLESQNPTLFSEGRCWW